MPVSLTDTGSDVDSLSSSTSNVTKIDVPPTKVDVSNRKPNKVQVDVNFLNSPTKVDVELSKPLLKDVSMHLKLIKPL